MLFCFLSAALPDRAETAPRPEAAAIVGRARGADPRWRDGFVSARAGEAVELAVLVRAGRSWYGEPSRAWLGGVPVSVRPLGELGATRVTWARVEPWMGRDGVPYSNAVLLGPQHGQWRGYDRIAYFETPVGGAGPTRVVSDARPTISDLDVHSGLGTMRWTATVMTPGGAVRAPGADSAGDTGIDPAVMRVSFRARDDFVGWLTSYFNVPAVFASAGPGNRHQTDRYVGTDCADALIGALRAARVRGVAYTSVSGLGRYAASVTATLRLRPDGRIITEQDETAVTLRHGADVREGDVVILDYVGFAGLPRSWDHVGVLGPDDGDGLFDADDLLYHMGLLEGLALEPLRAQGHVRLRVLRLRPRYLPHGSA
ncbi:MAG: hypothetical protein HYY06_32700 [Deltaproteobacteria bacterium]|nr:hypothetical protein [Deltaproteobacteria bacterium]